MSGQRGEAQERVQSSQFFKGGTWTTKPAEKSYKVSTKKWQVDVKNISLAIQPILKSRLKPGVSSGQGLAPGHLADSKGIWYTHTTKQLSQGQAGDSLMRARTPPRHSVIQACMPNVHGLTAPCWSFVWELPSGHPGWDLTALSGWLSELVFFGISLPSMPMWSFPYGCCADNDFCLYIPVRETVSVGLSFTW